MEINLGGHCLQLAVPAASVNSPLVASHVVHFGAAFPHAADPIGQMLHAVDLSLLVIPTSHETQAVSVYSIGGSEDCLFPAMHCLHADVLDVAALPMEQDLQP